MGILGLFVAGSATAQSSLLDPERAWERRQLDAIERRAVTDPAGAAAEARELRRRMTAEGRASSDPEAIATERRLRAIEAGGRPAVSLPPRPARAADPLASSVDTSRDRLLFETERDPLATADRLLERAAEGIAEGRIEAARSDLSLAAAELQMARGAVETARLERARQRLGELEARLPPVR